MIDGTAIVSPKAKLGSNVAVGAFTIIHDGVEIGDHSVIESHCVIGKPTALAKQGDLVIGTNALVRSHSTLYAGSRYDDGLATGHYVTLRENILAGKGLMAGSYSDFQGDMVIGEYLRAQRRVVISKYAVIKDFVWLFTDCLLLNDPHPPSETNLGVKVEDYAVVCAGSCILPGIHLGAGSLVGAGSVVTHDVADGTAVAGNPAHYLCKTSDITHKDGAQQAYPWTRHFHRGYPESVIAAWRDAGIGGD